ncbi:MAG: HAMP domain-containing sensor histidine kinase [Candidatus Peribacteraceae bacterium]|nr:HAMP domain-containing sensor histidine kinase [Candidatus Peribacteraceae bacterium]
MRIPAPPTAARSLARSLFLPVIMLGMLGLWGTYFFVHGRSVLEERLKSELRQTAAVAALRIDAETIAGIRDGDTVEAPALRAVTRQLLEIKRTSPLFRSAYIMRRTDDPLTLAFVSDADMLEPFGTLDRNGDGALGEDEQHPFVGERYDIREVPALQSRAFLEPTTDEAFTTDQWGTVMSGYAPVRDTRGKAVAVLGIDMDAQDYLALSQRILSPVAYLLALFSLLSLAGSLVLWIGRRRLEVLEEIERERTALLDLLLHQLGTPIATLRWWLEILHDHKDRHIDDVRRHLEESVARMGGIMTALYDASRFRRKHLASAGFCDVAATVEKVVKEAEQRFTIRRQTVRLDVGHGLLRGRIDAESLAGVMRELLENASSYSADGAAVEVRVHKRQRSVIVEVKDRGCGIPKAEMPRIGERFVRASNALKVKPVGNGLGLYIAKGIIRRAGGSLRIKSAEGKGTTVSFTVAGA